MTKKETLAKIAKQVKKSVEKHQKIPSKTEAGAGYTYPEYTYVLAKAIVNPGKEVKRQEGIGKPPAPKGTTISRTIDKTGYTNLAKNLISYVKKEGRLPNFLTYGGYQIEAKVYIDAFARIVNYYYEHKKMPSLVNMNSKAFTAQTKSENTNTSKDEVFQYFVKKFGDVSTIDGALKKVQSRGYGYYYDDVYSNKTAIDRMYSKSGINCTDSCQVFWHIAKALGYDVKCMHVQCSSGGHVRLKLRHSKHTEGNWINRDPACVLSDNGKALTAIWCPNAPLNATNPSWFLANVNR